MRLGKVTHVENVVDIEDFNTEDITADERQTVEQTQLQEIR